MVLWIGDGEALGAAVVADVGHLDAAAGQLRVRSREVVDVKRDRRRREVEPIRVVLHQRQRHELEGERLVGESDLHDLVAASCGNAFLAAELTRLKFLFRACRDVAWEHDEAHHDLARVVEEAHEHLAVVDALLAGRKQDAARAMARHINAGARYWSRAVVPPADTLS